MPAAAPNLPEGHRLVTLDAVDSTNAEAMRRALAGETGPLWIVGRPADRGPRPFGPKLGIGVRQSLHEPAGHAARRARLPRPISSLWSPASPWSKPFDASGCLDAGTPLRLKWPNDILIGTEKAGGILVESTTGPSGLNAVIGIGLNIVSHPERDGRPGNAPRSFWHGSPTGVSAGQTSRLRLRAGSARWQEGAGFADVRAAWLERAGPIGERCSVNSGQGRVEGRFAGLDADGALLILDANGQTQRYTYGDVTLSP